MAKIAIGMPYRSPGIAVARFGKTDMVIPYRVDGLGPYEVRIPEEDYTPAKGEAAVREAARAQVALYGKEITL